MYPWLVFLHVAGALGFMFGHGVTSVVTILMRQEKDPERVKTYLRLARNTLVLGISYVSMALLLITGIWAGFNGGWWRSWWIWISLALLVVIILCMGFLGRSYFDRVSAALGIEPVGEPVSQEELEATLAKSPAVVLVVVGLGGIAVILWLMMFKPF
jgi:hypothetical protein